MKIITCNKYNPNWINEVNPIDIIRINLEDINKIITSLEELQPKLVSDYVQAVKKRILGEDLQKYLHSLSFFNLKEFSADFPALNKYQKLKELIVKITSKYLDVTPNYRPGGDPLERLELDIARAQSIVQYYRTKAFADFLGKEKGIKLWKEIVEHFVDKALNIPPSQNMSMKEYIDKRLEIKSWDEGEDCTLIIFDDHRLLQKVERCMGHESYNHFKDPEFAYLSYCYIGDVADKRSKGNRRIRRRRTQTLYFKDFCDEFFWDDEFFPDAEHPSQEFMRSLSKEVAVDIHDIATITK